MIVDVLRNDLGRVCRPGTRPRPAALPARADGRRPAPRLDRDRPPRAGPRRVRPARGVVPGRLDHRRAEDPGDGDPRGPRAGPARPVHRRARLDRAGRGDADDHPDPDVRRRRPAADAPRRRRDHLAERPGGRVGRDRRQGARSARRRSAGARSRRRDGRRRATSGSTAGSLPADGPHLSVFDRGFQLGDGIFETLRARGGRPTELAEHVARLRRSAAGLDIAAARRHRRPARRRDRGAARGRGLDGPDGDASHPDHGLARRRSAAAACCRPTSTPPPTIVDPGLAGRRRRRPATSSTGCTSSLGRSGATRRTRCDAQDDVARRLRLRPARGPARRRRRRALPDDRRPPVRGDDREHLPRPPRPTASSSWRRRRSTARSCPGTTRSLAPRAGPAAVGLRPVEGLADDRATSPTADEAFLSIERRRDPAGHPLRGRADRRPGGPGRGRAAPGPTARR